MFTIEETQLTEEFPEQQMFKMIAENGLDKLELAEMPDGTLHLCVCHQTICVIDRAVTVSEFCEFIIKGVLSIAEEAFKQITHKTES